MTADRLQEAVRHGAAWLDQQKPGWADQIAPDGLVMDCPFGCVLGQTFGTYGKALDLIDPDEDLRRSWAEGHGFTADIADDEEFDTLRALWLAEVRVRRAGARG